MGRAVAALTAGLILRHLMPAKLQRDPHPGIAFHQYYDRDGSIIYKQVCARAARASCRSGWDGDIAPAAATIVGGSG